MAPSGHAVIAYALFPPPAGGNTSRSRHKAYTLARQTADEAATKLELLDYDFHLFTERATGQNNVIYRTGSGHRLAQARPGPGRLGPAAPLLRSASTRRPSSRPLP